MKYESEGGSAAMAAFFVFAIAVAVTISVAISVTVAISAGVEGDAVEDEAHVAEFLFLIDVLEFGELAAVEFAGTDDEDGEVGDAVDDGGVGDDAYGD